MGLWMREVYGGIVFLVLYWSLLEWYYVDLKFFKFMEDSIVFGYFFLLFFNFKFLVYYDLNVMLGFEVGWVLVLELLVEFLCVKFK